ncbi:GGDEF domain-containing protein [Sphingomonas dokdonensis]|uniref:Putative diguanylate cyclase YcdT n=1 Tax=Sphingomonas dokdonensis TaxID=344880 RepID=A0A245ZHP7_9SPHN|nr:sensor domain-containing diguanylate cyclase [Sphingomonas dokdonensis]OWK29264.1 putative diguanylate cyclase YcdT [Sphingomonas dokdonensis]
MSTTPARRRASLLLLGVAYFVLCAGTLRLTRFDGGVAFIWVAAALLTARLTTLPRERWGAPLVICGLASFTATSIWGFGPVLALPLALINVLESVIGAILLRRLAPRRSVLESQRWLLVFVLAAGVVAPAMSAILATITLTIATDQLPLKSLINWYSGHALGTLTFMPIFMLVLRGDALRLIRQTTLAQLSQATVLLAFTSVISIVSFAQHGLPLLFLPLLPMVLATFRGGPLSTAASIVMLAVIGGAFTLLGYGPIARIDAPTGARMQFLQLYIACAMLMVLPARAELQQRANLFRKLRESEARYRVLTEHSTDIVINVDRQGLLRFASTSIRQISGSSPDQLIGRPIATMLRGPDADRIAGFLDQIIAEPEQPHIHEFRAISRNGDMRWLETHSHAVMDDAGQVSGVVSAIRDVSKRKAHEERLAHAALTDPLTGLANRRGLDAELTARLSSGVGGCLALFDLDHFKRVNDTFGHATGDEVLRRFAALARASVRDQDLVARLGGEEFAVVLPDISMSQATFVCDRLRRAIGDAGMRVNDQLIALTVSGGVAMFGRDQTADAVLRAADAALYRAKHAGRDQVALAA